VHHIFCGSCYMGEICLKDAHMLQRQGVEARGGQGRCLQGTPLNSRLGCGRADHSPNFPSFTAETYLASLMAKVQNIQDNTAGSPPLAFPITTCSLSVVTAVTPCWALPYHPRLCSKIVQTWPSSDVPTAGVSVRPIYLFQCCVLQHISVPRTLWMCTVAE